jgi:ribosomal protein S27AE
MTNSADWFAKKMGNNAPVSQVRPDPTPTMPPSQQPMAELPIFQQSADPSAKAQSSRENQLCPDCGSENFFAFQNSAPRCYNCGYPVSQSGSKYGSLSVATVEGGTTQAQGNNTANNYNPQGIIGRIQ